MIRFLNMTVDDLANPLAIDTDKLTIFGVGTGGFVGFNMAVLDEPETEIYIPKFVDPIYGVPFIDTNALGDLKFMMPNEFSIYLHDTNDKALFAKNRRAYSHGCIRVEHPQQLARVILTANGWSESDLVALFDRSNTQTVRLKHNLPVHLTYQSSWVDNAGRTHFREDIYDHDAQALAQREQSRTRHENAQSLALASTGITLATNTY